MARSVEPITVFNLNSHFLRKRQTIDPKTCKLTFQEYYKIGPFYTNDTCISVQSLYLLSKIACAFEENDHELLGIVHKLNAKKFGVSLRMLDWLLTNYSKEFNAGITQNDGQVHGIFALYKIAMKEYRRDLFDVFRRLNEPRGIVKIFYDKHTKDGVEQHFTTVGQLNFVQWAHSRGILWFARNNIKSIEEHQSTKSRESNKRKKDGSPKKRSALTQAPMQQCVIYSSGYTLKFS